ncbi:phosphotransferase family protein [Streptomyces sp. NPDC004111]|uniref:phosphotransferase family protein n=1 Tax=Streptomyces sp. NPDC004111 TaxID=3364690 RepID=UPI003699C490
MEQLPHGYTNHTTHHAGVVTKTYRGRDAQRRMEREAAALCGLETMGAALPVPQLIGCTGESLSMTFLAGVHGQDLIEAGRAEDVLHTCGIALRTVHSVDASEVFHRARPGTVLVHGDFGPNNVLLTGDGARVTALLDWEWAHAGDPVEDLAWCEWIVRTHHPESVGALEEFFHAYGHRPDWETRHRAMVERCRELVDFQPHRIDLLIATEGWLE